MKSGRIISLFLMSIFAIARGSAPVVERSVSPSGEFIIYGNDAGARGAISIAAEGTKSNLLSLLHRRDSWTTPIVISLQSPAANLPELPSSALRFSQTGSGLKLQLDLTLSRDLDSGQIERELLRAILLEIIYRKQTALPAGESYVDPPAWLAEGLLVSAPNRDRASLAGTLNATDKVTSLAEFLAEKFELLDPAAQLLYRAYSFALVQWVLEIDDGRARLGRYIDNLSSASNDPAADLRSAFPELAGNNEKNWRSRIASLKRSPGPQTFFETEKQLADLLQTKFPSADGRDKSLSLGILCQRKVNRLQRDALKKFDEELILLSSRANPLLRPVVEEYEQLVARLTLGKNHGVASSLGELEKLRSRLSARMTEVDDYMNWFEATQLKTTSGLFENSLKSATPPRKSAAHRKDALSVYLDAVEQQN